MNDLRRVFRSKRALAVTILNLAAFFAILTTRAAQEDWSIVVVAALLSLILEVVLLNQLSLGGRAETIERTLVKSDARGRLIADTAGSVGRMAPIVRTIEARTRALGTEPQTAEIPISSARDSDSKTGTPKGKKPQSVEGESQLFPNFTPVGDRRSPLPVTAAVILDEFTEMALDPEWNQILVTPSNWRNVLVTEMPDILFVESAWNGNAGAWLYHLVGPSAPRPALCEMVQGFREAGVPTVFWNKEDPPHFEDFLPTAALFDHVFTSDSEKLPDYRRRLGHDNVGVLPFAAQPRMHNPARPGKIQRNREVAFGGMYFRHKYPERRTQMDFLLPAAARFKLDIFSRQAGGDTNYQFPKPYEKFVRGALTYRQMLTAYHAYKVFLNVNSVVDSPSMCARRIFEIAASGGAIVSAKAKGVQNFFDATQIVTVDSEEDAYHELRGLLRSPAHRDMMVHRAQREIWTKHTYRHRVEAVLEQVGRPSIARGADQVTVLAPTFRPSNIENILASAGRQRDIDVQLVLLAHGFDPDVPMIQQQAREYGVDDVVVMQRSRDISLGECLNAMVGRSDGRVLSRMDDDDFYGPMYLFDLCRALEFSEAEVVGKAASYIYFESRNATVLTYAAHEHRYTDFVRGATLTAARSTFLKNPFPKLPRSEDSGFLNGVQANGGRIYASDRFNFVVNRLSDSGEHTWTTSDRALFSTGEMTFLGNAHDQVCV